MSFTFVDLKGDKNRWVLRKEQGIADCLSNTIAGLLFLGFGCLALYFLFSLKFDSASTSSVAATVAGWLVISIFVCAGGLFPVWLGLRFLFVRHYFTFLLSEGILRRHTVFAGEPVFCQVHRFTDFRDVSIKPNATRGLFGFRTYLVRCSGEVHLDVFETTTLTEAQLLADEISSKTGLKVMAFEQ